MIGLLLIAVGAFLFGAGLRMKDPIMLVCGSIVLIVGWNL